MPNLENTNPREQNYHTTTENSELTSIRRRPLPDVQFMISPDNRSPLMGVLDPKELGIHKEVSLPKDPFSDENVDNWQTS